jgi:hypothetical protein
MTKLAVVIVAVLCLVVPDAFACGNCVDNPTPDCIANDRWPVKTLTDADAPLVNKTVVDYTVPAFHAILRPPTADGTARDPNHRLFPEFTTFRISANLKWVGMRDDGDMHMAIADTKDSTQTVVVELPSPECVGTDLAATMSALRDKVLQVTGPIAPNGTVYLTTLTPVTVTGVPFWDTAHGQVDQGPNYLELHPALDLEFSPPPVQVTCAIPTTRAVNICLPASNSTASSPLHIVAAANGNSVTRMTVALDGTSFYATSTNQVDTTTTVQTAGSHRVTVTAKDSGGYYWRTVYFTVQ